MYKGRAEVGLSECGNKIKVIKLKLLYKWKKVEQRVTVLRGTECKGDQTERLIEMYKHRAEVGWSDKDIR